MEQTNIVSPLSLKKSVKKVETFSVPTICKKYLEYGINVSAYFNGLSEVYLYECFQTGYRFYFPFQVVGDASFYENLSINKSNYYSHRWEHTIALKTISKYENILEVGSGFGAFLNLLKQNGVNGKGLELNPHAVKECNKMGLNVKEMLVQEEAQENSGQYDTVCSFQVLEHIAEVYGFIEASVQLLKKNGKLIIGVPNNNPYLFINDKHHTLNLPPHHAGLWNKKSLRSVASIFNLAIRKIQFEPLDVSYSYFIKFQINNNGNTFIRKLLKQLNRYFPKTLKKLCCTFINGRNVFVVYTKN